jgi:3-oxoadipate CoA-transferase alpha subunit
VIDKRVSATQALCQLKSGSTVFVGGFGRSGVPEHLIDAVCELDLRELVIVNNNSGQEHEGISRLIEQGRVAKLICSFPVSSESYVFREWFDAGRIEVEVVPQGTLAERIRCAGAGLGGFLTPTGVGTDVAAGKTVVPVDGRDYLLERPLRADVALIKAEKVDPRGNLTYRMGGRNFNPIMAMAAQWVVAEAKHEVALGALDPEVIVTPGIFVDRYCITGTPVERKRSA